MNQPSVADAVRYIRILSYAQIAIGVVAQSIIVSLQIAAFRRHRQQSFLLLSFSTICGILVFAAMLAVYFVPHEPMPWLWVYSLGFLFFCTQAVFGLIGLAKLLRDYRELASARVTSNDNPTANA